MNALSARPPSAPTPAENEAAANPAGFSAITHHDMAEAVRETAMLADITLAVWSAERTDHKIMADAKAQAGAVGNVGRAIKNLLAGADEDLRATRSAFSAVRAQHYALTLPWVSDPHAERQRGPRLLPNMLWDKYALSMGQKKRAALAALDAFVASYPDCARRAQSNLGGLANAQDYPSPAEVRGHFRIAFDFEPIPDGGSFRGLPEAALAKLEAGLKRKQQVMLEGATKAMWSEIAERVGHLAARMSDPEARFKASTVAAVSDLAALIPGWNIASDPRAAEVAADIDRMMRGVQPHTLREDAAARMDVATQATAVADKLRSWGL